MSHLIFAWGANSHGQLADNSKNDHYIPTSVPFPNVPKFISGGGIFSVIANDCNLWAAGQLDQKETTEKQMTFVPIGSVKNGVQCISCGWDFFVILTALGQLYFRGRNSPGFELEGDLVPSWIDKVSLLPLNNLKFSSVAAGLRHVVAVADFNKVLEFKGGTTRDLLIEKSIKVTSCSAGAHHSVISTADSKVGVWGDNRFGQCGPLINDCPCRPKKANGIQWISSQYFNNENIIDVQSGWSHILALTESGKVYSWGRSDFGQLGRTILNPDTSSSSSLWPQKGLVFDPTPQLVQIGTSSSIRSISAGAEHSLALTEDGQLWTWGWNEHGNCGIDPEKMGNVLIPKRVVIEGENRFISLVAAGYGFSMSLVDV
nr:secretion regulating guanine nucleotide exchange [Hymenolepis microstoma]